MVFVEESVAVIGQSVAVVVGESVAVVEELVVAGFVEEADEVVAVVEGYVVGGSVAVGGSAAVVD